MLRGLCLFVACLVLKGSCLGVREREKEILDRILGPDKYDPRLRPPAGNATSDGATTVTVNLFVRSISSIDDIKMQYNVQLTFRQQWMDERLKYDDNAGLKYLTLTKTKLLWTPDLFFSNENEGHFHDIMVPNVYFRIHPDGSVLYSRRLSLTLGCPMNLKSYPLDQQVCTMRIASYGYSNKDIILAWKESDPVQVVRNLYLPNFSLQMFSTEHCDSKTNTGTYSCIKIDFLFKRNFFHYLIHVYIPSCMIVILSWSSFWFDPAEVTAKLILSFLTLMILALQTSFISASQPQVSYTNSMNVWTGVCLTFVFAAFVEFVLVNYINKSNASDQILDQSDQNTSETDAFLMKPLGKSEAKCTLRHHFNKCTCFDSWSKRFKTKAQCIDATARILFPLMFLLFNLVYWIPHALN
ncbi:hypothetical protein RN001_010761 [Aquatica leii]|uniref:Glutamate-gated chloride channel n=1 Tax=Aquatica leii TaxID=1421715 RepID=A0AAN7Q3J2_9COLE|nr:hypothetical protein RN001_010761 [Aquatica leii]